MKISRIPIVSLVAVASIGGIYIFWKVTNDKRGGEQIAAEKLLYENVHPQEEGQDEASRPTETVLLSEEDHEVDAMKTYDNSKYGFSLAYPSSWSFNKEASKYIQFTGMGEYGQWFRINVSNKPFQSASAYERERNKWRNKILSGEIDGPGAVEIPKMTVDTIVVKNLNTIAERRVMQSPVGVDATAWVAVFFKRGDHYYKITYFGGNEGRLSEIESSFYEFLQSIKFQ